MSAVPSIEGVLGRALRAGARRAGRELPHARRAGRGRVRHGRGAARGRDAGPGGWTRGAPARGAGTRWWTCSRSGRRWRRSASCCWCERGQVDARRTRVARTGPSSPRPGRAGDRAHAALPPGRPPGRAAHAARGLHLRLGRDRGSARGRGAVVGAGRDPRLSRQHVRLPHRRGRAPRERREHRGVLPPRGGAVRSMRTSTSGSTRGDDARTADYVFGEEAAEFTEEVEERLPPATSPMRSADSCWAACISTRRSCRASARSTRAPGAARRSRRPTATPRRGASRVYMARSATARGATHARRGDRGRTRRGRTSSSAARRDSGSDSSSPSPSGRWARTRALRPLRRGRIAGVCRPRRAAGVRVRDEPLRSALAEPA